MGTSDRYFRLRQPCANCPFRSDVPKYLGIDRVKGIADSLRDGASFPCHKTTVLAEVDEDGREDLVEGKNSAMCAGALITMEREDFANQIMRSCERLGSYDKTRLKMDSPVYDGLSAWVNSYREETDLVHCGVVGDYCEDPAGYLVGGAIVTDHEPTVDPNRSCAYCGNVCCEECGRELDGEIVCVYCFDEGELD
jgi:hypothetical protein